MSFKISKTNKKAEYHSTFGKQSNRSLTEDLNGGLSGGLTEGLGTYPFNNEFKRHNSGNGKEGLRISQTSNSNPDWY